jgi:uncharacterized protein
MKRIVYLHGFASSPGSSKARRFRQRFEAAGARIDIPDLAEGDFARLTISRQLEVVERTAAGHAVSLVGSSMGGYLAALYAARHPEVTRLVLMAPAFGFARRWTDRLGREQAAEWRRTGTVEVFHYAENRMRRLGYELVEDAARYEDYPDFRQPALIFHGRQDDVVPAAFSQAFAARHPAATLELLDSGHDLLNALDHIVERAADFLLLPETPASTPAGPPHR